MAQRVINSLCSAAAAHHDWHHESPWVIKSHRWSSREERERRKRISIKVESFLFLGGCFISLFCWSTEVKARNKAWKARFVVRITRRLVWCCIHLWDIANISHHKVRQSNMQCKLATTYGVYVDARLSLALRWLPFCFGWFIFLYWPIAILDWDLYVAIQSNTVNYYCWTAKACIKWSHKYVCQWFRSKSWVIPQKYLYLM